MPPERCLVQRVEANVQGESERVAVRVTWAGGLISQHDLVRPVRHYRQHSDYPRLLKRIKELRDEGKTLSVVAEQLNREGFQPPKRVTAFTANMVGQLLLRQFPTGAAAVRRDGAGLL